MFKQDYIMHHIREMIRAMIKLLFNVDTEFPSSQLINNPKAQDIANALLKKAADGHINEAENELYEIIEHRTSENLMIGLIFYSYLNELNDDFLKANDFNRDEVKDGIKCFVTKFGLGNMTDLFMLD